MPQSQAGRNDKLPGHTLTGVKIKHERVGLFDVIDRSSPRMQLHDTDLHQTQEALKIVDPKADALPTFPFLDLELMNCRRHGWQRTLMIKGDPARVAHELQRPASEVRQGFCRNLA